MFVFMRRDSAAVISTTTASSPTSVSRLAGMLETSCFALSFMLCLAAGAPVDADDPSATAVRQSGSDVLQAFTSTSMYDAIGSMLKTSAGNVDTNEPFAELLASVQGEVQHNTSFT